MANVKLEGVKWEDDKRLRAKRKKQAKKSKGTSLGKKKETADVLRTKQGKKEEGFVA